ncbi:CRISPR-associated endonuclease Cas2 [Nitrososphaera viennensis]|uniref:CRISPR-associated endoribonuclease Cas2 n=2 Tax=Nitrososphaera viennensis TaxID=1034015 RepID=A0A060HS61_9ARCH|nr:CRISPR-associated endonuclease Cas2 [Nitrososphaera viennensis]AIC15992.1 putative CRISPR-associated protein, Cas2 family [Nitrososphaera viennensis EN76]UVS67967.1 CRISPR-associated endonuclease Cas2 [Nitrososphaera viennensis]
MKANSYYAIYDISDNLVRSNVIRILKNAGFVRIQKSAFCGTLVNQKKKDLLEDIKRVIKDEDSFYLILTCQQCFGRISVLGKGFDAQYATGKRPAEVL